MYTYQKATAVVLNSDEQEQLDRALESAGESNGYPVLELRNDDEELIGSVVFHADTPAEDLTD